MRSCFNTLLSAPYLHKNVSAYLLLSGVLPDFLWYMKLPVNNKLVSKLLGINQSTSFNGKASVKLGQVETWASGLDYDIIQVFFLSSGAHEDPPS